MKWQPCDPKEAHSSTWNGSVEQDLLELTLYLIRGGLKSIKSSRMIEKHCFFGVLLCGLRIDTVCPFCQCILFIYRYCDCVYITFIRAFVRMRAVNCFVWVVWRPHELREIFPFFQRNVNAWLVQKSFVCTRRMAEFLGSERLRLMIHWQNTLFLIAYTPHCELDSIIGHRRRVSSDNTFCQDDKGMRKAARTRAQTGVREKRLQRKLGRKYIMQ